MTLKTSDNMFRPSPPTSLSLPMSFILQYVTVPSQAHGFTITTASSADHWHLHSLLLNRLGNLMSQLHSFHTSGPSPGKSNIFPVHPIYLQYIHRFYVKEFGLRWSRAPYPLFMPYEGSLSFR